ncbi:MAG: helix-turn-helix domain-containing protein [Gaiellaceae bacterium]
MAVDVEPRVLLTKAELARFLRCSQRTVDRLRASGKLRAVQFTPGGRVAFRPEDVDALLAEDLEWR